MSPALQPQPQLITLEQYETLPADKRVEVFDGVVYDMDSPSQIHQAIRQMIISASSTTTKIMVCVNIGLWTQNEKQLP